LWIASKRRKTEEEQEDAKLMGVYNLRFFLKTFFMEGFFQIFLTDDFFQFCVL
jgi:cell shape-determining protein MreD